jgi:Restriction endonuclease
MFDRARRELVRGRMLELVQSVDALVSAMRAHRAAGGGRTSDQWSALEPQVSELERLLGDSSGRPARWSDLRRHLSFWEDVDLDDILNMDWPAVKADLDRFLYDEFEPVPVDVDDLGALVSARPSGPVSTGLSWSRLDADTFERLLFDLVSSEAGYENPNWLMKPNATDSGRDVEVHRVTVDGLSGTRRERVVIQCKHWQTKSVGRDDLVLCEAAVRLWEPPRVDVLVVATSGRFSKDAVAWKERRDQERTVPRVELWSDSHLEMLLARRPHMIASYGLR